MSSFKLILFDLDDTLVYFRDYWEASAKEAFRYFPETRGLNCDELFHAYRKHDLALEQLYLRQEITVEQYRIERITRTLREHGIEIDPAFALTFENQYKLFSRLHIKPIDEITKTLQLLSRNYHLGIITNGTASWQYNKIEALRYDMFFSKESIFISEQIGVEKPHPLIYQSALDYFSVEPSGTMFVGDNWRNDVAGPTELGIKAVWLNEMEKPVPVDGLAYGVIKKFPEILRLLKIEESTDG